MRFGSVCSGIEAASVAWEPLGWKAAWFAEIEPFPSAVLAHHYPETPNLGDMTRLPEFILGGQVEAPDILCGGTPCQAFSVAGLRKSLDDARGNLSLTFCEIANAIDTTRALRGERPAVVFWENVPGVLSTKDNAFGCFLAGLAGEDVPLEPPGGKWTDAGCVSGPARTVAWRILDAQHFELAQRRRRVFIVASAREDFDPIQVLLEFEGVRRDSAPSREAGQRVAPCVTNGAPFSCTGNERVEADAMVAQPYPVANTLTARMHKGINSTVDEGQTPVLAHFLRGEGFDASEDGTGRGTPLVPVGVFQDSEFGVQHYDSAGTLRAGRIPEHQMVMQPVNIYGGNKRSDRPEGGFYVRMNEDTSKTLDAATGLNPTCSQGGTAVMQPVAFHPTQDPISSENVCHSISSGNGQGCATAAVAVAPSLTASNDPSRSPQSSEITAQVAAVFEATAAVAWSIMPQNSGRDYKARQVEVLQPLMAGGPVGGNQGGDYIQQAMQVRRLTPVECERLQGFPDDYTAIPWRGKPAAECPDGPRYKALGNSWAVPVVRWIGERINCFANLV